MCANSLTLSSINTQQPGRQRRAGSSSQPGVPLALPQSTSFCSRTHRRIFLATQKDFSFLYHLLRQTKVHFTALKDFFDQTLCFSPQQYLPRHLTSPFHSSNLCCLHSKNNCALKSSSTGQFKCYHQGQTSPSANSLHFTPKDQLMKCKTPGLFD